MKNPRIKKYIVNLVKKYPKIASGRKNFHLYEIRIQKTLKLIDEYFRKSNN